MPASSGKAQSSSSIITPETFFWKSGRSSSCRIDRLVLAEHLAGSDAEQQAVADLAGSAGHGDTYGGFRHGDSQGDAVGRSRQFTAVQQ
jgi:hypothetical protein